MWKNYVRVCGVAGAVCLAFSTPACAHNAAAPALHVSPSAHHYHNYAPVSGWHGHHRGYGFYGYWPWYFPVGYGYGYGAPYYGTTFLVEAPASYVEMAPEDSGIVQPATSWYYCREPEGYFPYVKTCPSGWQTVPMQPVPADPAVAPAN